MPDKIQAIDFMYYVATRDFMEKWDRAKEGELICRMERAIGGLPRFESIEAMLGRMDEAGVEKVFITQTQDVVLLAQVDVHGHQARRRARSTPRSTRSVSSVSRVTTRSAFARVCARSSWR